MESVNGALVCAAVVEIARNVRNVHAHTFRVITHWVLVFLLSTGCLACFCPALIHAQNRRRVNYLNTHGVPDPERERLCGTDSLLYGLLEACFHMGWILQVSHLMFRGKDYILSTRCF